MANYLYLLKKNIWFIFKQIKKINKKSVNSQDNRWKLSEWMAEQQIVLSQRKETNLPDNWIQVTQINPNMQIH